MKKALKKFIDDNLDAVINDEVSDEGKHAKLKMINDVNKTVTSLEQRQNNEKDLASKKANDEKRFQIEFQKINLSEESLKLERDKFEFQKEMELQKARNEANDRKFKLLGIVVPVIGTVLTTVITTVTYASLTRNAQRHDYNDFQMESQFSKEARNKIK